jgi:hypothetical protein
MYGLATLTAYILSEPNIIHQCHPTDPVCFLLSETNDASTLSAFNCLPAMGEKMMQNRVIDIHFFHSFTGRNVCFPRPRPARPGESRDRRRRNHHWRRNHRRRHQRRHRRQRKRRERSVFVQQLESASAEQRERQRVLPGEVAFGEAHTRKGL